MSSALDEVLENKQAQEFWLRRLVAFIIDAIIIYVPITVMVSFAWTVGFYAQIPWLISGTIIIAYTALFESELGYTIGKRIMNLEVVSLDPRPYDMKRALMRNLTKIHGVFLLLDLLLGILREDRVNMRYIDTVVNTEVVDTEVAEWRRAHGLAPPVGDEGAPHVTVASDGEAPEPTMPPETSEVEAPEVEAPEPPSEDELIEVPPEEGGAPGIAPPPVPPPEPPELDDELEEITEEEVENEPKD
jgi:uncharacterized RDD family membrane protein YckC